MQRHSDISLFLAGLVFVFLASCVLRPEWQRLAIDGGLEKAWIDTGKFEHLRLSNNVRGSPLRIYVDGDGTPWIRDNRVSIDPTPTNPVLLRLMHEADHPAVYLGRPCYFGTATDGRCEERWWTFDRYGEAVIESMCDAANEIAREFNAESVQLIGFSGGGAIVIRMSECTDLLVALTTIAGNLDPAAWSRHHGYSPLNDNTVTNAAPPNAVIHSHWQCSNDENIPPAITDDFFRSRPVAKRYIVEDCTHSSGWQEYWSRIIGGTFLE